MTENIEVTEEIMENGHNPMVEMVRRLLLAGIGVVALTQEEVEKFVNKLVERGEIAEQDGRKLVKDVMDKRRKKTEEVQTGATSEIDKRMEDILSRMNIPSKSDIDNLSQKITELTAKVDELQESKS